MSRLHAPVPYFSITERRLAETIPPSSEATSPDFAVSLSQLCFAAARIICADKQHNRTTRLETQVAQGNADIEQRYGGKRGAARLAANAAAKSERMHDAAAADWGIILGARQLKAMGYGTEAITVITSAGRQQFIASYSPESPLEQRNAAINHFVTMAENTAQADSQSVVAQAARPESACTQLSFSW